MSDNAIQFIPGKVVMTPGAMDAIESAGQRPSEFLLRHIRLEQGELDNFDQRENRSALNQGLRMVSRFKTSKGVSLYLITELVDVRVKGVDPKHRKLTTILLPEEY